MKQVVKAVDEQDQQGSEEHLHTHTRLTALFQDYPGEPVTDR